MAQYLALLPGSKPKIACSPCVWVGLPKFSGFVQFSDTSVLNLTKGRRPGIGSWVLQDLSNTENKLAHRNEFSMIKRKKKKRKGYHISYSSKGGLTLALR